MLKAPVDIETTEICLMNKVRLGRRAALGCGRTSNRSAENVADNDTLETTPDIRTAETPCTTGECRRTTSWELFARKFCAS